MSGALEQCGDGSAMISRTLTLMRNVLGASRFGAGDVRWELYYSKIGSASASALRASSPRRLSYSTIDCLLIKVNQNSASHGSSQLLSRASSEL